MYELINMFTQGLNNFEFKIFLYCISFVTITGTFLVKEPINIKVREMLFFGCSFIFSSLLLHHQRTSKVQGLQLLYREVNVFNLICFTSLI